MLDQTTLDLSRGSQFFVRFPKTHGTTVYLYDKDRGLHVPFTSNQAFKAFTGGISPDEAYSHGMVYDLGVPLPGTFVPDQYGFREDGHTPPSPYWEDKQSGKGGGHDGQGGPSGFIKYVKVGQDPTVYGITPNGQYVAFESADQFLQEGGNWSQVQNVSGVPSNAIVYNQYKNGQSGQATASSPSPLSTTGANYGLSRVPELEDATLKFLGGDSATGSKGILPTLAAQGAISQQSYNNFIANPVNLAKYVSALAYGGYTVNDIYRDVKAKEMGLGGSGISTTMKASDFYKTPEYATIHNNPSLNPPTNLNIDKSLLNSSIFQIPGQAFKTLVPVMDVTSQSFKEDAEKVKLAYYDLLLQQLDAKSVQEKSLADDNYKIFKEQLDKKYGIALADDAVAAWSQIQQLTSGAVNTNMLNSGVYNEALDKVLQARRLGEQRMRDNKQVESDSARKTFYLTKASPQQIQNDLTPEERQRWGLTAPQTLIDWVNALKQNYPDLTDNQIAQMRSSLIDENGNLRSDLYRTLFENKYNLTQQKSVAQQDTLLKQKLNETDKAYEPFSQSDNPFLQWQGTLPTTAETTTPVPSSTNDSGLQMPTANNVAGGLGLHLAADGRTVLDAQGNYVSLDQYKQLTGQTNVPNEQLDWSVVGPARSGSQSGLHLAADGKTVLDASNNYVSFDKYKEMTGQADVPNEQLDWSFVEPSSDTPATAPEIPAAPTSQVTNKDLSSTYANQNGKIVNKQTGREFSTPQEFFQEAGVNSFDGVKFDTSTPVQPQPQPQQPQIQDLSGQYANVGGTIVNKQTQQKYSTPQEFFNASGVNSFDNLKLDTSYTPPAPTPQSYNLSGQYGLYNGTVYNKQTNQGYSDPNQFFSQASIPTGTSWDRISLDTGYRPPTTQPTYQAPQPQPQPTYSYSQPQQQQQTYQAPPRGLQMPSQQQSSQVSYGNLVNVGGEIRNPSTGKRYSSQDELARDLGTTTGNIQWGQIRKQ